MNIPVGKTSQSYCVHFEVIVSRYVIVNENIEY